MYFENEKSARLIFSDGTVFEGVLLGAKGTVFGEVVFNTSMTGYVETLTDASYFGQIVVQTFPLIGNYGVSFKDFQSSRLWLNGYIVKSCCNNPSNSNCDLALKEWLIQNNIVAIKGLDTRQITKKIRENGVLNGAITTQDFDSYDEIVNEAKNFKIKNAVQTVSTKKIEILNKEEGEDLTVCVLDFGVKKSIVKNLQKRFKKVILLPYNTKAEEIFKLDVDGIVLSNGPGDPKDNEEIIENLKEIQNLKKPIFGICLGHQLLAIANGAKTEKLKYGHRGANQPVIDLNDNKIYITSQNHGYYVLSSTLKKEVAKVYFSNLNDGSCEGIIYNKIPAFSVQFHPEAAAGPKDANFLFDEFLKLIKKTKKSLTKLTI